MPKNESLFMLTKLFCKHYVRRFVLPLLSRQPINAVETSELETSEVETSEVETSEVDTSKVEISECGLLVQTKLGA